MSSDMQEIEMHNTPEPGFTIEQIGDDPKIVYHVDWQRMEHPTPAMLRDVNSLHGTLAVLTSRFQNEEVSEAGDRAFEAVTDLLHTMVKARDELDDQQAQQILMGNLEALPEVMDVDTR